MSGDWAPFKFPSPNSEIGDWAPSPIRIGAGVCALGHCHWDDAGRGLPRSPMLRVRVATVRSLLLKLTWPRAQVALQPDSSASGPDTPCARASTTTAARPVPGEGGDSDDAAARVGWTRSSGCCRWACHGESSLSCQWRSAPRLLSDRGIMDAGGHSGDSQGDYEAPPSSWKGILAKPSPSGGPALPFQTS